MNIKKPPEINKVKRDEIVESILNFLNKYKYIAGISFLINVVKNVCEDLSYAFMIYVFYSVFFK